ncbi:protein kinase [Penicillium malachiteum]|uniref:protein kinase n=1 Tax=Penicillium malachiteum TaxID=1324776 RepID=UPI0025487052|nr:protein kinase [Penicillium malachiteum]KAJ5715761.1 protein kinase [Penicillium malachiteum]
MIMRRLAQQLKQSIFGRWPSPARKFPQPGTFLDANSKLEEETLKGYLPHHFYPVNIGDMFRSRYQVVGKLGYGSHSTVWLSRDLQQHAYVTLKMYDHESSHARTEKEVYKHIESLKSSHTGFKLVRRAIDDFEIRSPDNAYSYQCLVHPPLGMSLCELRHRAKGKMLPEDLLKPTLIHILLALDFLHTEAGVVHTDIQENNVMLGVEDESILVDFEEAEMSNPSPRKAVDGRVIYASRNLGIPKMHGRPILSDFGEARFSLTLGKRWEDVQPLVYRAPEVILRIPWDEKIDIWNLATLTWNLFEQGSLFKARDSNGKVSDSHHLARMIAIMGPPPKEMLQGSEYAAKFFDSDGNWRSAAEIPCTSLEKLERNLQGTQQSSFLCFMRKMLQWQPENRASAKELLADPWLRSI